MDAFLNRAALALPGICGLGLAFRVDGFRLIFALLTTYMWLMTGLFTPEYMTATKSGTGFSCC